MKVKARVDDRDTELTLTIDESRVFATVDGRKYELEFYRREDGSYLVLKDGQVFDCRVNRTARKENFAVAISDRSYSVGISDPGGCEAPTTLVTITMGVRRFWPPCQERLSESWLRLVHRSKKGRE